MGRNRVVAPDVDRIPLSDGDWIEVKRDLNNGDAKKLEAAGLKPPIMVDGKIVTPIDWEVYEILRAAIYLTDWSFRDADDRVIPLKNIDGQVSIEALRIIDPASFEEINRAIFSHALERTEAKKSERDAKVSQTQTASVSGTILQ